MKIDKIVSGKLDNNTYFLKNDFNECIIVDASCDLEDALKQTEGYTVLGIFLTHGHYDHFVNLDKMLERFNTKCYMFTTELEKLRSPKLNYSIVFNTFFASKVEDENVVLIEKKEDEIVLGHFNIKSFLTKGHTDGCLCYLVDDEYLFTGDTKFKYSSGRTNLITGNEEEMVSSLIFLQDKFKGMHFYPGHGSEGDF